MHEKIRLKKHNQILNSIIFSSHLCQIKRIFHAPYSQVLLLVLVENVMDDPSTAEENGEEKDEEKEPVDFSTQVGSSLFSNHMA